jgi:hypothetical protein
MCLFQAFALQQLQMWAFAWLPIPKNMGEGVLRECAFQRHLHALDDGLKLILLETKSFVGRCDPNGSPHVK